MQRYIVRTISYLTGSIEYILALSQNPHSLGVIIASRHSRLNKIQYKHCNNGNTTETLKQSQLLLVSF
jgi:hypothetical protein